MGYLKLLKTLWPLAVVVALVIAMGGAYVKGRIVGKEKCQQEYQKAIIKEQTKQADLVEQLESAHNERKVEIRESIKVIEKAVENTECGNPILPDEWVNSLRN